MTHWPQKPPLGVQIDRGHPLANGLVACWLLNEGGGSLVNDLSGNGKNGTVASAMIWQPGRYGMALFANTTAARVAIPMPSLGNQGTIAFLFDGVGTPATTGYFWCNSSLSCFFYRNSSDTSVRWSIETSATAAIAVPDLWGTGVHLIVCTWDSDLDIRNVYVDGLLSGSDATAFDAPVWAATLYFGDRGSTPTRQIGGSYEMFFCMNRVLTASGVQQLYSDPFAMFRRARIELWGALGSEAPAGGLIAHPGMGGGIRDLNGGIAA